MQTFTVNEYDTEIMVKSIDTGDSYGFEFTQTFTDSLTLTLNISGLQIYGQVKENLTVWFD